MLDFADGASAYEKSYITIGQIPEEFDAEGVQSNTPPFSTISHRALVHTVSPILTLDSNLFLEIVLF